MGMIACADVAAVLAAAPLLTTLSLLSVANATPDSLQALAAAAAAQRQLRRLNVHSEVPADAVVALMGCQALEVLNMRDCSLYEAELEAVAAALPGLGQLRALHLRGELRAQGLEALAAALPQCGALTKLGLHCATAEDAEVEEAAGRELGEAIVACEQLVELRLSACLAGAAVGASMGELKSHAGVCGRLQELMLLDLDLWAAAGADAAGGTHGGSGGAGGAVHCAAHAAAVVHPA